MNNSFFAMDTAFYHRLGAYSPLARAQMLKELGYSGTMATMWSDQAWAEFPELLRQLDQHQLQLMTVYVGVDAAKTELDPRLPGLLEQLRGRQTLIELSVNSSDPYDKPSSSRADNRAAKLIRDVLALTTPLGLKVALYPHSDFLMERVEDAVRLGMRVNRAELGLTFNAYHWLVTDGQDLPARLQLAGPRMWNATICGCSWRGPRDVTIEPLDSGNFDAFYFLCCLALAGYTGPIGLQAYSVGGDVYANLRRSLAAWKDLSARVDRHVQWGQLQPTVEWMRIDNTRGKS